MASIEIGAWQSLPSEGGEQLAFDGERMAVAGSARLCVWQGKTRLATVDALSPSPGAPRFVGERVYWGPGFVDLHSGAYTRLEYAAPLVRPGDGEHPHVYAWSTLGDRLLGSYTTGDRQHPVRVALFNVGDANKVATLWNGGGLAPQAAWLGRRAAVAGFSNPQVFDFSGKRIAEIALDGAIVVAFDATTAERRLIAVDQNRALAWVDTERWTILDRWPGPWLHGAVSPDGRFVAVLEPWGKLHFACLEGDRLRFAGQTAADPNAVALALTPNRIATVGGGEVRWASLMVECDRASSP